MQTSCGDWSNCVSFLWCVILGQYGNEVVEEAVVRVIRPVSLLLQRWVLSSRTRSTFHSCDTTNEQIYCLITSWLGCCDPHTLSSSDFGTVSCCGQQSVSTSWKRQTKWNGCPVVRLDLSQMIFSPAKPQRQIRVKNLTFATEWSEHCTLNRISWNKAAVYILTLETVSVTKTDLVSV